MSEPGKPRNIAAGIAFLVIGLIFLVPSGLCSGYFGIGSLLEILTYPQHAGDAAGILMMVAIFGGPFLVAGFFLVRAGIRNLRGR